MERKYRDIVGERIKESNTDLQNLPGMGKPLPKDYTQKDTFQHFQKIVKDAGFLPPWLQLQKEIASLLHEAETESDIEEINKKVKKYNRMCPNPLQKNLVSLSNLEKSKKSWESN